MDFDIPAHLMHATHRQESVTTHGKKFEEESCRHAQLMDESQKVLSSQFSSTQRQEDLVGKPPTSVVTDWPNAQEQIPSLARPRRTF